jgi:hypothetical protein
MKTLDLVRYSAVRGDFVLVDDVLAVDPARRGEDAKAEIERRARACVTNFGELSSDKIIRNERYGVTWRSQEHRSRSESQYQLPLPA